ncbi:recombination-associated protein RdgC [Cupriavidus taiwanensis]|nr:recombination-associated protein RdgC [Cupriavidus taiwanensis]
MWFRNLTLYRLPEFNLSAEELAQALKQHAYMPCTDLEMSSQGWIAPRDGGSLVHAVNGQMLITLCVEKKLLPAAVVKEATQARAAEAEEQQGFKPGRKQMREIKDAVTDELLPKAFSIRTKIAAWIDPANGWLAIDAPSSTKADALIGYLFKSVEKLDLVAVRVKHAPVAAMTEWLATDAAPAGFTIDQDAELRATGEGRATVRYVQHALEPADVSRHIAAGKRCTQLAMTWNDRVSFVLTDGLTLKRVAALDVIKETAGATEQTADEAFDGDFLLMAGELGRMLADLMEALGGEQAPEAPNDLVSAAEDAVSPASGEPDPLYPQAVEVVQKAKRASISFVQRHLRIGYNRAARLLEQMEGGMIVSSEASDGSRRVLAGSAA